MNNDIAREYAYLLESTQDDPVGYRYVKATLWAYLDANPEQREEIESKIMKLLKKAGIHSI